MTRRTTVTLGAAIALLVPSGLLACSSDDGDGDVTTSAEVSGSALPPVIVDLDSLEGTTVEVREGGAIDITGDDETFTDWTATIADPAVVTFTPGRDDGSAQFNPGLQATAVGTTEVTLTNSSSATTLTFTVHVTAA